jgi:hypothetical protein
MARGRTISKAISLDEKVDSLSDDTARLLFTWLIPQLDCEGRMYGDANVFKSLVAPRRDYSLQKVEKVLVELENLGLIVRYSNNEHKYLCCPNFEKHQIGLRKDKESPSQIPAPTPEQLRNKDGIGSVSIPTLVPPKRREENINIKEVKGNTDFMAYTNELITRYPTLDIPVELDKFILYWSEGNKQLKRPKTAFRNWLDNSLQYKAEREAKLNKPVKPSKYGDGW